MKQNSVKKTRVIAYITLGLFLGAFLVYGIIYKFPTVFQETITKIERDITVTDEGIADAVDKVYNSVIIVTNYRDDKKYASGSGFVYKTKDGYSYILTNHHVIADGTKLEITYIDGEVLEAELLGSDQYSDIAVLKVKAKEGINDVVIGKTDTLRVGDTTFTVGAPLDYIYSWTVTRGIISGKERYVEISLSNNYGDDYVMNVLQTDAAVNSGNSGGPLCNSNGEVIGVISAKISSTGVEGIGFAIPIENALAKADQIVKGEPIEYPYLGASMVNVTDAINLREFTTYINNQDVEEGVILYTVEKNSSLDVAKLQRGDIIIKINDKDVKSVAYLRYELYKYQVGDKIKITYLRNGKENTVTVKLSSRLKTN